MTFSTATTSAPAPAPATQRGSRGRRVKALLAGGLVLGVGAAMTLAAWNDSEFASGTFTTGAFDMVGSTDGTTFTDHATLGTAATLPFTVYTAGMTPGDVSAAPFAVRLTAPSTAPASVTVSAPAGANTGELGNFTYTVLDTGSTTTCTAATTGTPLIPAATALGTVPGSTTFTLPIGTGGNPGTATNLCFKVTANAEMTQSASATATWQFLATSQ